MNWQVYLKEDLALRQSKNSKFSLRSYSRLLEMSPSHLSYILNGKRKVAAKTAIHLHKKLGVAASEAVEWLDTTYSEKPTKQNKVLREEEFSPISEWYYYAILGLSNLDNNVADPFWISKRLKISPMTADLALKTLINNGQIKIVGPQFRQIPSRHITTEDVPSSAIRRCHKQILELAKEKIETVPVESREYSSTCLPIDPKKMKNAKKLIRDFREKFMKEMDVGKKSEVYYLAMQFFPVTEER
ncbi:MAG: TIGR02147 family protein [Bdellovibrionota bacterium]